MRHAGQEERRNDGAGIFSVDHAHMPRACCHRCLGVVQGSLPADSGGEITPGDWSAKAPLPMSVIGTVLVETLATTVTPGIASLTEEIAANCPG